MRLEGNLIKTVVVSDVHLGHEKCDTTAFLGFIDEVCGRLSNSDQLILLGDILDYWVANSITVLLDNAEVLERLRRLRANVRYVVGNHDYSMLRIKDRKHRPFIVSESYRFQDSGASFFLTHGYELDVLANWAPLTVEDYEKLCSRLCHQRDEVGWILSRLYAWITDRTKYKQLWEMVVPFKVLDIRKPPNERGGSSEARIRRFAECEERTLHLGMKRNDHLVFGHTHEPFHNVARKVANTGCWLIGKPHYYVWIENGVMKHKEFVE